MGPGSGVVCDISLNTTLTDEERRRFQDPGTITRLLATARTIAIVGLSSDPQKASSFVATYLQKAGYRIIPVTPRKGVILGEPTVPDLLHLPVPVDIAVIFRPGHECLAVAEQAIAAKIPAIWFQLRIHAKEAAERSAQAGLTVVLDKCIKMEHGRFAGTLHWGGMNTEIVSARKARRKG
ncbi:MAG: CoA-binding protein [Gemmatimonadales bacterium]